MTYVDVTEFRTTRAHSKLDLNNVKYNTYKQPKEKNLKVMERIRSNIFMYSGNNNDDDDNNNNY
jgi:hypothetical protein